METTERSEWRPLPRENHVIHKSRLWRSTIGASDVRGVETLPAMELPTEIKPVKKSVLIELLDPRWKLAGDKMPEKIEGLAFGPDLADGRKTLVVTSDNDFEAENLTYVWVFALPF